MLLAVTTDAGQHALGTARPYAVGSEHVPAAAGIVRQVCVVNIAEHGAAHGNCRRPPSIQRVCICLVKRVHLRLFRLRVITHPLIVACP